MATKSTATVTKSKTDSKTSEANPENVNEDGPTKPASNGVKKASKYDYSDSSSTDFSSSDSESDDARPPPMIALEKSSDVGSLKSTFLQTNKKSAQSKQRDIEHRLGKENLTSIAKQFETAQPTFVSKADREQPEVDKEKISNFKSKFEKLHSDRNELRDCSSCSKKVYPVERVLVELATEKRVFHRACFKCCKCQKSLSAQNLSPANGKLYCKTDAMEVLQHGQEPEKFIVHGLDDEDEIDAVLAKAFNNGVVKSGLKATDDLGNLPSLKGTKQRWEAPAEESKIKRTEIEQDMFKQGKVKSRLTKFTAEGDDERAEDESDGDEANVGDPNIVRSSKKSKEKLKFEVGSIKSKWEKGDVEKAAQEKEDRDKELEELKRNVSVKQRFKEKAAGDEDNSAGDRRSRLADEQLDFAATGSVREKFKSGEAFRETEREKQQPEPDARCAELGNIRATFEQQKKKVEEDDEELQAEMKRMEIEAEFKRFKKEKRKQQEKERREQEERNPYGVKVVPYENPDDVRQCAEMGSIKKRFEEGSAFKSEEASKSKDDMGKAPRPQKAGDSESDDEFEVQNLLSKFKNIEKGKDDAAKSPKPKRQITPPPADYKAELESQAKARDPSIVVSGGTQEEIAAIKADAKNLKAKFENLNQDSVETDEEKKKRLEEEFRLYKEQQRLLKELQKDQEPDEPVLAENPEKEDLALAAERAQKMREKWDKIQRKEAKKAQKAATIAAKRPSAAKSKRNVTGQQNQPRFFVAAPTTENSTQDKTTTANPNRTRPSRWAADVVFVEENLFAVGSDSEQQHKQVSTEDSDSCDGDVEFEHTVLLPLRFSGDGSCKGSHDGSRDGDGSCDAVLTSHDGAGCYVGDQSFNTFEPQFCYVCDKKVYAAEKIECDTRFFHKTCFKCKYCNINLRIETYAAGIDGIYCRNHYRELFNNMSRCLYDGRSREATPVK